MDFEPRFPRTGRPSPAAVGQAREIADIVALLRQRGPVTRPMVVRETGLGRAVVAQRLADLQASGLIVGCGSEASSGGRPPRQLMFNAALGHVLVADLGATSIDVAAADLAGRILVRRSEEADIASGPEPILHRVEQLFDDIVQAAIDLPGRLWGIGIGIPGPVEFSTARPVSPPIMPGWDGYLIRARLSGRYGAPVWVDNDVNVMALGERAEGIGQNCDDMIFVKIGTGIGAGIVSHGTLQRGAQGSAGDVGHIQVIADPAVVCRCGKIGCLEAIAGGGALGRTATRVATQGESAALAAVLAKQGIVTARDVAEAARHGDQISILLLREAGRYVGQMLAAAVNLLNPALIVIGGGVAESGDVLISSVREVIFGRSTALATRHLRILQSILGDRAGITGAAVMVLDELFARDRFQLLDDVVVLSGHGEVGRYGRATQRETEQKGGATAAIGAAV
ncbi:MAG: ROK family protein [Thermomicrobiales bacterium]